MAAKSQNTVTATPEAKVGRSMRFYRMASQRVLKGSLDQRRLTFRFYKVAIKENIARG